MFSNTIFNFLCQTFTPKNITITVTSHICIYLFHMPGFMPTLFVLLTRKLPVDLTLLKISELVSDSIPIAL